MFEGRRVDRNLVSPLVKHLFCVPDAANATGNTERDVNDGRNAVHPASINGTAVRAGRDVVKDEFVSSLTAVTLSQIDDVTDNPVISELDAFDNLAVANVETGDYAFRWNAATSSNVIAPSSRALPVIAAGIPDSRSSSRS